MARAARRARAIASALTPTLALLALAAACDRASAAREVQSGETDSAAGSTAAPAASTARAPRRKASRWEGVVLPVHIEPEAMPDGAPLAGRPLTGPLRVRLVDADGTPVPDLEVEWRIVRGGGAARPERTVSDADGWASAIWTPGAHADSQTVLAIVDSVGYRDFHLVVPVATTAVEPARPTLWPGDTLPLRLVLRDAAGTPLEGASHWWTSGDPRTVEIGRDGVARALQPGTASLVAHTGTRDAETEATVYPALVGALLAPVGSHAGTRASARLAGETRALDLDAAGRFAERWSAMPEAGVAAEIAVAGGPSFHDAAVSLPTVRDLRDARIVLVPRRWTIDAGAYAGQTVEIDPSAAVRRSWDDQGFWRVTRRAPAPAWAVGWMLDAFPLRVAFRRDGGARISDADSVAFWSHARALEQELGRRLFEPATDAPDAPESVPVVVRLEPGIPSQGITMVSWDGRGTIGDAEVIFRSAATMRDERVAKHELMHALGLGHNSSWPSVLGPSSNGIERPTAHDVAYAQLLFALRRLQQENDARYGVLEAGAAR